MLNTIKTMIGFQGFQIRKCLPMKSKEKSIEKIFNYLSYSDTLSSSGQPTKKQLSLIRDAGYAMVINLAPYDFIEYPLKDEEAIVTRLGMKYIHIPVNMYSPEQEDYNRFATTMNRVSGKKVWVHCAANMRASAFVYRYRCSVLGEDNQKALWDLREIWEPFGAWKNFVFGEVSEI